MCRPANSVTIQWFLPLLFISLLIGCDANSTADSEPFAPAILSVGGHSAHDFDRWFDEEDTIILEEIGATVTYTDELDAVLPQLDQADILYLSTNQRMTDPALHQGITEFVESGKGLLIVHAGGWYNWQQDWPEYYRDFVGGGTRSHPPLGEFEVYVTDEEHPIMEGVPARFTIRDELYRFSRDQEGADMNVLASTTEEDSGEEYPVVWTTQYGDGRIVNITLGHDGDAHTHEAYIALLQNSIHWLMEE